MPKGIQVERLGPGTRFVDVGVFPMGIDFDALRKKTRRRSELVSFHSVR